MDICRENDLSVSAQINYVYKIYWFCPKNKSFVDFMNIFTQKASIVSQELFKDPVHDFSSCGMH